MPPTDNDGPAQARLIYKVEAKSTLGGAAHAPTPGQRIEFDASAGQRNTLPGPADLRTAAVCEVTSEIHADHVTAR